MNRLRLAVFTGCFCAMLLVVAVGSASAEAHRVALLHEGPTTDALANALRVELAGAGVEVIVAPAPVGETTLLRAASAQSMAREAGAIYAIWVEAQPTEGAGDLLRVVDPESDHVRDAPLPESAGAVAPRVFAAVAGSLIGELSAPPDAIAGVVRVRVLVETPTGSVEVEAATNGESGAALPAPAPGATIAPAPVVVVPAPPAAAASSAESSAESPATDAAPNAPVQPREGFVLSASLVTAGIATGAELGLGYYLSRYMRLSLVGMGVVQYVDDPLPAGTFGLDITRVGARKNGRFDIGAFASLLVVTSVTTRSSGGSRGGIPEDSQELDVHYGFVAGAHIGWMWELNDKVGMGFRVSAGGSYVDQVLPFGLLSFRTEFPL